MDSTGKVAKKRVVTSDSCSDGICSTSVPLEICIVRVQATSLFGNSAVINLGKLSNFVFVVDLVTKLVFIRCYFILEQVEHFS